MNTAILEKLTRVLIVEDHEGLRIMLRKAIDLQKDLSCCGAAASGEEALRMIEELEPALVVADLSLPGMNGIELIQRILTLHPDLPCAVCSGHDEREYASQALRAGARGYIVKGNPFDMIAGIRQIVSGEIFLSARVQGARA